MKIKSAIIGGLALAFSLGSAHAGGKQFVVNGDFTQLSPGLGQFDVVTTATGWSADPSTGYSGYNFVFSNAGTAVNGQFGYLSLWDKANGGATNWNGLTSTGAGNFAALDGDFITHPITQTVTGLTVGAKYHLTFQYAFAQQYGYGEDTQQNLTVGFGNTFTTTSTFDLPSHGFSGWMNASDVFTASSSSEVLSFLAYGNLPVPPFALVSNVSLTGGVPEPSTWALMLAGFACLGFAGHRRAKNRAVA
jgi:hypothetical protein